MTNNEFYDYALDLQSKMPDLQPYEYKIFFHPSQLVHKRYKSEIVKIIIKRNKRKNK